ncbi:MAG: AAA family ATPase [Pseudomonadota bacterium]|nr:AAA family ATPase [Pseudomonadota bacterium]
MDNQQWVQHANAAMAMFHPKIEQLSGALASVLVEQKIELEALEEKKKRLSSIKDEVGRFSVALIRDVYRQSNGEKYTKKFLSAFLLHPLSSFGNQVWGVTLIVALIAILVKPYVFLPIYAIAVFSAFHWTQSRERARLKENVLSIDNGENLFLVYFSGFTQNAEYPYHGHIGPFPQSLDINDCYWRFDGNNDVIGTVCLELQSRSGRSLLLWRLSGNNLPGEVVWWDEDNKFLKNDGVYYRNSINKFEQLIAEAVIYYKGVVLSDIMCTTIQRRIDSIRGEIKVVEESAKKWGEVILPDDVIQYILKRLDLFDKNDSAAPKGLLLFGPPGTGKTFLAKAIAESTHSRFLPLSLPDLKSSNIGGSGQLVRNIWEDARRHEKTIIFVDECEGVFGRRGSIDSDPFTNEIVQAFLSEWDGMSSCGNIWVIGATNRKELIDPAIVSRFGAEIEIPLPREAERKAILINELRKLGIETEIPDYIGQITAGMSGRDLAFLAKNVKTEAYPYKPNEEHFRKVAETLKKRGSTIVSTGSTWDTLVLPKHIKDVLQDSCLALQHSEILKKQGLTVPRGILLYGPPGTGKTEIARTIANESKLQFLAASTADIKGAYIGHSGKNVKELFERARANSPAIVFIDEIESIVPSRSGDLHTTDTFTRDMVTQMLQELDGIKSSSADVFLIAATNHREMIDAAILSRLSDQIEIPLPDIEARAKMFELKIGETRVGFDLKEVCNMLAVESEELSGRDIHNHVYSAKKRAGMRAIRNNTPDQVTLKMSDFQILTETHIQSNGLNAQV